MSNLDIGSNDVSGFTMAALSVTADGLTITPIETRHPLIEHGCHVRFEIRRSTSRRWRSSISSLRFGLFVPGREQDPEYYRANLARVIFTGNAVVEASTEITYLSQHETAAHGFARSLLRDALTAERLLVAARSTQLSAAIERLDE